MLFVFTLNYTSMDGKQTPYIFNPFSYTNVSGTFATSVSSGQATGLVVIGMSMPGRSKPDISKIKLIFSFNKSLI